MGKNAHGEKCLCINKDVKMCRCRLPRNDVEGHIDEASARQAGQHMTQAVTVLAGGRGQRDRESEIYGNMFMFFVRKEHNMCMVSDSCPEVPDDRSDLEAGRRTARWACWPHARWHSGAAVWESGLQSVGLMLRFASAGSIIEVATV
eukprot:8306704-Heterocapsa_arctica.AAC.2